MSLEIVNLKNSGTSTEEYILLQAKENVNLFNFAIVDRTFDEEGKVSDIFRHFYRFPSQVVKKDEYVVLYTGKGKNRIGTFSDGTGVVHYFYWGSDAAIWNDANTESAELLKVATVVKKTTGNQPPKKKQTFTFTPKK
jgi:hypothetical protein